MFFKATLYQVSFMMKQKGSIFTFFLLLAGALANFFVNIIAFQGSDIVHMYNPMKLLLVSYNRIYYNADFTLLFIQLYPFLVACPAGFSLMKERQTKEEVLIIARMGNLSYRMSKLLATMLTTATIFTVPFLVEIFLNCVAFPLHAQGDLSNLDIYDPIYIANVKNYLLYPVYLFSPYLYAILGTLFLGFVSGIISGFIVSFASIFKIKYAAFMFLPAFLLLNITIYFPLIDNKMSFQCQWYHYILLFDDAIKSPIYLVVGLLLLLIISISNCVLGGKQDCLS